MLPKIALNHNTSCWHNTVQQHEVPKCVTQIDGKKSCKTLTIHADRIVLIRLTMQRHNPKYQKVCHFCQDTGV